MSCKKNLLKYGSESVSVLAPLVWKTWMSVVFSDSALTCMENSVRKAERLVSSYENGHIVLEKLHTSCELSLHSVSTAAAVAAMTKFDLYATVCGLLHDVGKAFIPPAVLYTREKLTTEQFAIIQEHAHRGSAYIAEHLGDAPHDLLSDIIAVSLYHHEFTKKYSFLPHLADISGSSLLPSPDLLDRRTRRLLDAISMADSLSAVGDDRSYMLGSLEKADTVRVELASMCNGEKYLRSSKEFLDILNNLDIRDKDLSIDTRRLETAFSL